MTDRPSGDGQVAGYRIDSLIGEGSTGRVYRAGEIDRSREVALKLLNPRLVQVPGFRERFVKEVELATNVMHPHVASLLDAGETDGTLYLASMFVDGVSLSALVQREGKLAPKRAARIVAQVAGALDAAHTRGLIHRGVSGRNVLIASEKGEDHAYLTDFAITADGQPNEGIGHPTPDYAAPEQIEGVGSDEGSDVYALGCVLHEALTGHPPFPREDPAQVLAAHLYEAPPRPSASVGAPRELDDVVAIALAKSPKDRFDSPGELGQAALAAVGLGSKANTGRVKSHSEKSRVRRAWERSLAAGGREWSPSMAQSGKLAPASGAAAKPPAPAAAPAMQAAAAPAKAAGPAKAAPPDERPATPAEPEVARSNGVSKPPEEPPGAKQPERKPEPEPEPERKPEPAAAAETETPKLEPVPDAPPEEKPDADEAPAPAAAKAAAAKPATDSRHRRVRTDGTPETTFKPPPPGESTVRKKRSFAPVVAVVLAVATATLVLVAGGVFDSDDSGDEGATGGAAAEQQPADNGAQSGGAPAEEPQSGAEEEPPAAEEEAPAEEQPAEREPARSQRGSVGAWPSGRTGWTAVVYVSPTNRARALNRARAAARLGYRSGVLRSDSFGSLRPGFWVAFAGVYSSQARAERAVARTRREGVTARPYTRFIGG